MNNGRNKALIGLAKAVIIILIIWLVSLILYGLKEIGNVFKTSWSFDNNSNSREIEMTSDDTPVEAEDYKEEENTESEFTEDEANESLVPTYLLNFDELDLTTIPEYTGMAYVVLNDNLPEFTQDDKENPIFEYYSPLDLLERCGVATANLGLELMPTEERGAIGNVKPSGWHTIKYPEIISDLYLYNRCHLIAFSLAGENDNEKNLITGTRYMNMSGMLPFENDIANYIELTGNHVLYRVTPCFDGNDLVAKGVHMEAWSIEDEGIGICFNIFAYNVQPGITIDYATGDSWAD